jgi:hypothetical protein
VNVTKPTNRSQSVDNASGGMQSISSQAVLVRETKLTNDPNEDFRNQTTNPFERKKIASSLHDDSELTNLHVVKFQLDKRVVFDQSAISGGPLRMQPMLQQKALVIHARMNLSSEKN